MQKITIEIPKSFHFETLVNISIHQINYGNHMSNSAYLEIAHEARLRYLGSLGMSEMDFSGKSLIMGNVAIQFKKEVFHRDILKISISPMHITKLSFDLIYKFERKIEDTFELVALIKTGMVCFDYQLKKIMSIPEQALSLLSKK